MKFPSSGAFGGYGIYDCRGQRLCLNRLGLGFRGFRAFGLKKRVLADGLGGTWGARCLGFRV